MLKMDHLLKTIAHSYEHSNQYRMMSSVYFSNWIENNIMYTHITLYTMNQPDSLFDLFIDCIHVQSNQWILDIVYFWLLHNPLLSKCPK